MAEYLIQEGNVIVRVNPAYPGVVVPSYLMGEPFGIEFGLNMSVPIVDLKFSSAGIEGTFSFNRRPFSTLIPWGSIEDIRSRSRETVGANLGPVRFEAPEPPPRLRPPPRKAPASVAAPAKKPRRGHLRLVK